MQAVLEGAKFHYDQPVFVTLFNSAMSAMLLLPRGLRSFWRWLRRRFRHEVPVVVDAKKIGATTRHLPSEEEEEKYSFAVVLRLSSSVGLLWLVSQCIFNLSLECTPVATSTVLSSTSSVFTFVFSWLICRDPFRLLSFSAALLSCIGCAFVALQTPGKLSKEAVQPSDLGTVLTLAAAALFALSSVMLRRLAPTDFDTSQFMGINGLLSASLTPALLYLAHLTGLETFRQPTSQTLVLLAVNALFGCTIANYLYTSALLLLSPLVATVFMSLSIPISAVVDEVLLKEHRFSVPWIFGASLTAAGAVLASMDLEDEEPADATKISNHVEGKHAEAHELESLIGAAANENDDEDSDAEKSPRCKDRLQDVRLRHLQAPMGFGHVESDGTEPSGCVTTRRSALLSSAWEEE
eukprot:TRINITY_DN34723_c0_g1_i1.p1 TRINITY_DN34723_c0_g1~~TRINITY_DN34723_c0_g1_i1.p1  ORF type:complete len:481 (+),score=95.12 TRINITY_DN34723_c0_g1_i1:218-1444(+)